MPKENYSEKEVTRIIKRAAELESRQSDEYDSLDSGPGLSLEELSQIAIDAGLDPENVRRAAGELSSNPQASSNTDSAKGNEVISEEWVMGEFTNELADLVIADLNHRYNTTHEKPNWKDNILNDATVDPERQSSVQRTGRSLEWKKLNEYGTEEIRVLIQPRNDQIRIKVTKQNTWGGKFSGSNSIGHLSFISYFAGVFILFALPFNLFINAIFGVGVFALLQFFVKRNSGWFQEKISGYRNQNLDSYRSEVRDIASDLASLVEQPSINKDRIEIDNHSESRGDSTGTRISNSTRSRNSSK